LKSVVTDATARRLNFGRSAEGAEISPNDFVTSGSTALPIEFAIPAGATQAELVMDARLDLEHGDDCVVRCVISHKLSEGATVAAIGTFSALLANPTGQGIEKLKAGVSEFARILPQISHRE